MADFNTEHEYAESTLKSDDINKNANPSLYSKVDEKTRMLNEKAREFDHKQGLSSGLQPHIERMKDNETVQKVYDKMSNVGDKLQEKVDMVKQNETVQKLSRKLSGANDPIKNENLATTDTNLATANPNPINTENNMPSAQYPSGQDYNIANSRNF